MISLKIKSYLQKQFHIVVKKHKKLVISCTRVYVHTCVWKEREREREVQLR